MLDYTTCCKLRDAGLRQDDTEYIWWTEGKGGGKPLSAEPYCTNWSMYYDVHDNDLDVECACPNSDELVAAIQQRWPGAFKCLRSEPGYAYYVAESTIDDQLEGIGDTPAAALAALYLALAGGE